MGNLEFPPKTISSFPLSAKYTAVIVYICNKVSCTIFGSPLNDSPPLYEQMSHKLLTTKLCMAFVSFHTHLWCCSSVSVMRNEIIS